MNLLNTVNAYEKMKEFERVSEMIKQSSYLVVREYRSLFFSERLWRKLPECTRKKLLSMRSKSFYVRRYIANILDNVRFLPAEEEKKIISCLADAIYDIVSTE